MSSFTDFESFNTKVVHENVMHLSIYVDSSDSGLKNMYVEAAEKHNKKIMNDPHFYDAGFDLFLPKNEKDSECYGEGTRFFGKGWKDSTINKVDFKVKCCAKMYVKNSKFYFTPFYTYARSSISKTPLRLANNQGIIDAGYRGSLIGMFDCIYNTEDSDDREFDYYMPDYSRILQICAPGLVPIYVHIVDNIEELGPSTSRGEGGIGSTGK
jgi:dUTP pyrophosphatase